MHGQIRGTQRDANLLMGHCKIECQSKMAKVRRSCVDGFILIITQRECTKATSHIFGAVSGVEFELNTMTFCLLKHTPLNHISGKTRVIPIRRPV